MLSKNKEEKRKGKIQLIDASSFYQNLRKSLGNKRKEISPEDRATITKLYADFEDNEYSKIYKNTEFIYREYTVMQPLQRSYAINDERIENLLSKGSLSSIYDEAKVSELEDKDELTSKEKKTLDKLKEGMPLYNLILDTLKENVADKVYLSLSEFTPVITDVLAKVTKDKKNIDKVIDGLSVIDKSAEVQKDKKGNIIYDKDTKDTEIVKVDESIDDYMAREVLPHVPDAKAFFEEELTKGKLVIKTGAEIPFTRYFYKYQQPTPSAELKAQFLELEKSVSARIEELFK